MSSSPLNHSLETSFIEPALIKPEPPLCEVSSYTIDVPVDGSCVEPSLTNVNISEIDLSGYNYDLVLTYKMIEDPDDQDSLFRIQFLQAFGINDDEYHPDIVSAVIDDLYERYRENTGIRDILESHPLYRANTQIHSDTDTNTNTPPDVQIPVFSAIQGNNPVDIFENIMNDNSEMIFCMMFSFELFDLFHTCIRHAKLKEEIPRELYNEIIECFRNMF